MSTQPYAQALPPTVPPKKKPGMAGVILGIVLAVVGPIIGVIIIVTSAVGSVGGFSSAPVFSADGSSHQVSLTANNPVGVWTSQAAVGNCQMTDPSGNTIDMVTATNSQTINNFNLSLTFTPTVSGSYTVMCQSDSGFQYKVASLIAVGQLAGGIVVGVIVIIVTFLGGLALLIITLVRRSSWNSKYGPTAAGYAPSPAPYAVQPPQPTTYGQQPSAFPQPPAPAYAPQPPVQPIAPPPPQSYGPPAQAPAPYAPQPPASGQQPPASPTPPPWQ